MRTTSGPDKRAPHDQRTRPQQAQVPRRRRRSRRHRRRRQRHPRCALERRRSRGNGASASASSRPASSASSSSPSATPSPDCSIANSSANGLTPTRAISAARTSRRTRPTSVRSSTCPAGSRRRSSSWPASATGASSSSSSRQNVNELGPPAHVRGDPHLPRQRGAGVLRHPHRRPRQCAHRHRWTGLYNPTTGGLSAGGQTQLDIAATLGHTMIGTAGDPTSLATLANSATTAGWTEMAHRANVIGQVLADNGIRWYWHTEQNGWQFFTDARPRAHAPDRLVDRQHRPEPGELRAGHPALLRRPGTFPRPGRRQHVGRAGLLDGELAPAGRLAHQGRQPDRAGTGARREPVHPDVSSGRRRSSGPARPEPVATSSTPARARSGRATPSTPTRPSSATGASSTRSARRAPGSTSSRATAGSATPRTLAGRCGTRRSRSRTCWGCAAASRATGAATWPMTLSSRASGQAAG